MLVGGALRLPGAYAASVAEVTYRQAAVLRTRMDQADLDRAAVYLDPSRAAYLDMRIAQERGLRTPEGHARLAHAAARLERGLRRTPADAYAWTRRAAVLVQLAGASPAAARSLSVALMIAPHDRKLGPMQFDLAVALWPAMEADGREALTRRARFIAGDPTLAPQLHVFAATALGQSMLGRAP